MKQNFLTTFKNLFAKSAIEQTAESSGRNDAIFVANRPNAQWADYGAVLYHGMSVRAGGRRSAEDFKPLRLERTGPFVPPISFPGIGNMVVTDAVKHEIENVRFKCVLFLEVQKELIVKNDWHTWDLSAPNPPRYPRGGDPGNYLIGKHSEEASEQMGRLWNLALAPGAVMERFEIGLNKLTDIEDRYVSGTWNGADFFTATLNARIYLSDRAAEWLRHNFPEWIDIQSVRLTR